ncbi:hypothetical protein J6590_008180 [Homalodisca vitripennis]|nr:hypothetical protein J6590_008180 [Homalodisca vitripennis]
MNYILLQHKYPLRLFRCTCVRWEIELNSSPLTPGPVPKSTSPPEFSSRYGPDGGRAAVAWNGMRRRQASVFCPPAPSYPITPRERKRERAQRTQRPPPIDVPRNLQRDLGSGGGPPTAPLPPLLSSPGSFTFLPSHARYHPDPSRTIITPIILRYSSVERGVGL